MITLGPMIIGPLLLALGRFRTTPDPLDSGFRPRTHRRAGRRGGLDAFLLCAQAHAGGIGRTGTLATPVIGVLAAWPGERSAPLEAAGM